MTISGTAGKDRLSGTVGNDYIEAFGGNDTIVGSEGFDFIDAGDGTDIVNYSQINNAITLQAAGEVDKGVSGLDTLVNVERVIAPIGEFNVIDASTRVPGSTTSIVVNLRTRKLKVRNIPGIGTQNFTVDNFIDVIGTDRKDEIEGNSESNILRGEGGKDVFRGSEGFDFIDGGSGTDVVNYARIRGPISLKPAGEIDKGAFGTDTLFSIERVIAPSSQINDIDASTSSGDVSIVASLLDSKLTVRNIPGIGTRKITVTNFIDVTGTHQGDVIEGNNDSNFLIGLGGDDLFRGTEGFDFISGDDGFDTVNYDNLSQGITLKAAGEIDKGVSGTDTLFQVERIIAPSGQTNTIDASDSSDVSIEADLTDRFLNVSNVPGVGFLSFGISNFTDVIGSQTNDAIKGSQSDNFIDAQNGDDFITATRGNDFINGSDGFDTIDYTDLNAGVTLLPAGIVQKEGSAGTDTAFLVERFIGAANQDNRIDGSTASLGISFTLSLTTSFFEVKNVPGIGSIIQFVENFSDAIGTSGNDFIEGNSGSNSLDGFGGNDDIFGGAGDDDIFGGAGSDFILGEAGIDFISGGDGNDFINGTSSTARGRNETDALLGGGGSDLFTLGDISGSFYKATSFPSSDFDSFGFGGFQQAAFIGDLESHDTLVLGRGETYRAETTSFGFDLYVANSGRFDAVASVTTNSFISNIPTGDFSLASGQTLSVFVGA